MGSLDAILTIPQGPHGAPGPRGPHGPSGSEVRTLGLGEGLQRWGHPFPKKGRLALQSRFYPLLSLQGSPGLRGGVGQPGAVGEKVRERGRWARQGWGGTTSSDWGWLSRGPFPCLPTLNPHFASCRVSQGRLETQDCQEPQASQ